MSLIIDLTPSEEAQLAAAARQTGLAPADLVKKLVKEHLPAAPRLGEDDIDARLRKWQREDGTRLTPDVSTQTLFAQWAQEDAQMTEEEREAEDRLWQDLEARFAENCHSVQFRRLS